MKFFHLSDLHIGKYLNGYNLKENQEAVLGQIIAYAEEFQPDAILICGDIYDKSVPSGEACEIFDRFLESLDARCPAIPVFIIAGNHDSPSRLAYASGFLKNHGIYLATEPPKEPEEFLVKVTLKDVWGPVHFYLLPFLKPGYVRKVFPGGNVENYEDAVRRLLAREEICHEERNVLLSHQFYTWKGERPQTCESELLMFSVGGVDEIDARIVESFDYVALGHLHGAQKVGRDHIRYCGSPSKYSVSEEHHRKAVTVVTLEEKGTAPKIDFLPLKPVREVRRVCGSLEEVLCAGEAGYGKDFVSISITDRQEAYRLRQRLEEVYPCLLEVRMEDGRTGSFLGELQEEEGMLPPMESFRKFYQELRGIPMSEEEEALMEEIFRKVKEDGI